MVACKWLTLALQPFYGLSCTPVVQHYLAQWGLLIINWHHKMKFQETKHCSTKPSVTQYVWAVFISFMLLYSGMGLLKSKCEQMISDLWEISTIPYLAPLVPLLSLSSSFFSFFFLPKTMFCIRVWTFGIFMVTVHSVPDRPFSNSLKDVTRLFLPTDQQLNSLSVPMSLY